MAFVRERVAEELAENEKSLRDSSYGRKVWRNWKMDLYQRRRVQWVREVRDSVGNDGFQSFPDANANGGRSNRSSMSRPSSRGSGFGHAGQRSSGREGGVGEKPKTALDRARERHARNRAQQQSVSSNSAPHPSRGFGGPSGANAIRAE